MSPPKRRALSIGVDAGGTSTRAVVIAARREIVGSAAGAGANPHTYGLEVAVDHLVATIHDAAAAANVRRGRVRRVAIGCAGVGDGRVRARLLNSLRRRLELDSVTLVTDAEAALAAVGPAPDHGPAIALIAGTGSIAIGRDATGRRFRAGGYGPRLGDAGSAPWIGREILIEALAALDAGKTKDALLSDVIATLDCSRRELRMAAHRLAAEPVALGRFAATVAARGTLRRGAVLESAADRLASLVRTVRVRICRARDRTVPLATFGGVFEHIFEPDDMFTNVLRRICDHGVSLRAPRCAPELAVVELARSRESRRKVSQ